MWPANVREIQERHFHTRLKLSWDNIRGFSNCPYIQTAKPCMLTWVNISWPNSTVNRLSFRAKSPSKEATLLLDTMQRIHTHRKTKPYSPFCFSFQTIYTYVMLDCATESAKPSVINDPRYLHFTPHAWRILSSSSLSKTLSVVSRLTCLTLLTASHQSSSKFQLKCSQCRSQA